MADDEQFSLCWNNFNSNLSAGFHESLCRGDLVDVTLAAEGQFVKAHRLVLSVCSPYFRKMFTQMPANQHAFVFLKDVSHSALKDLIQFMYCGEVNVKQDALPAFISTAEALQIKGLTDGEPAPSQSPAKPSTPAPQNVSGPSSMTVSPRVKQRSSTTSRSYKIESEESGDDKSAHQTSTQSTQQNVVVQQTQKRPAQRSITPHAVQTVKRVKNSDPLEAAEPTQQITVQTVSESKTGTDEPEFIDLPIDLPTKSEPDYADDTGEVEAAEQEATYVEDDSYGDMKYDESYFTENDETGAAATTSATVKATTTGTFSESYVSDAGEQTTTEAQVITSKQETIGRKKRGRPGKARPKNLSERFADAVKGEGQPVEYLSSISGGMKILYNGHHFKSIFKRGKFGVYQCSMYDKNQCEAKVVVYEKFVYNLDDEHNHLDLAIDGTTTEIVSSSAAVVQTTSTAATEATEATATIPITNKDEYDVQILNFQVQCPSSTSSNNKSINQLPTSSSSSSKVFTITEEFEIEQQQKLQEDCKIIITDRNDGDRRQNDDYMAPEDFKAKIKQRLQKALLGSKI